MSMCFNRRVVVGLGIAGVALVAFGALSGRGIGWFVPILFVLACPLAMVAMMAGMRGSSRSDGEETAHEPSRADADREVAQLRAEVAELRLQQEPARPLSAPGTGRR